MEEKLEKKNYICVNGKKYDFETIALGSKISRFPFEPEYNLIINSKGLYLDMEKDFEELSCERKTRQDTMQVRLEELKEKITSFVNDYNIQNFEVHVIDGLTVPTMITINIRV